MIQNQALQADQIESDGYFPETIGPARLLDHYHKFIFSINISEIENNIQTILNYSSEIRTTNKLTNQLHSQLMKSIEATNSEFHKFSHKITKRGLVNLFGKAIKFIAGNPDDDDLQILNSNIETLFQNQKESIQKINSVVSLAHLLTKKFQDEQYRINRALNATRGYINAMTNEIDNRALIQSYFIHIRNLKDFLEMLERTISLAWQSVPNLEMFQLSELLSMQKYLLQYYKKDQLFHFDSIHPFKIIKFAKTVLSIKEGTLTIILKVPILENTPFLYKQIFPLPNKNRIILVPPKQYLLDGDDNKIWTSEVCEAVDEEIVCFNRPMKSDPCDLRNLQNCTLASLTSPYKTARLLRNNQVLIGTTTNLDVTEDCGNNIIKSVIKSNCLIYSKCRVLIDNQIFVTKQLLFKLNLPNITTEGLDAKYNLKPIQLDLQFEDLKNQLEEIKETPLHLHPIAHVVQSSIVLVSILVIIILIIFVICFKDRIRHLFFCKNLVLRVPRQALETAPHAEEFERGRPNV